MTYHYATAAGSTGRAYHLVKPGRVYALCGILVRAGKAITPEPPAGMRECLKCAKIQQEQSAQRPAD